MDIDKCEVAMCYSCNTKNYNFTAFWITAAIFLAMGCGNVQAASKNPPYYQTETGIAERSPQAALVINSACSKIFQGDFETALRIVDRSTISDSRALRSIRNILDEYMAIRSRRKALQNKAYQTQINELKEFRQQDILDDANNIDKVFLTALRISEHAGKQQKQALLRDPLLIRTIRQAKAMAAEFEAKGKWLDAYTICYSNLTHLYQDNHAYSDHAEQLLLKADILASLRDSPCETSKDRYTGIKKQMFIKAVDILNSSYVDIIDYRRMAIKGIDRCKLLLQVMSRSSVSNEHRITNSQYAAWLLALDKIANETSRSQIKIGKNEFVNVFNKILAINRFSRTGMALPAELLIAQFARGSMSGLDPYTVIYWPSQVQDFKRAVTNQFSGIGIKFSKQQGLAQVVSVLPGTPAHRSDLQAGDIIWAVDGIETKDMTSGCVLKSITGLEGTKVTLTIKSSDKDKARDITLDRAKITVPTVHGWQRTKTGKWVYMVDEIDKIGYIRISSFSSATADDLENALCRLERKGLNGLILDLRSNPGGLLTAAAEVADKFIAKGLIVRTQPRFGMATYISAHKDVTHPDYPVVVLINSLTASSSEILAGVLQDKKYNRAILVGEKSYGKGSVQSITSQCGENTQLKYTMAYYHMPSGQRVESREVMEKSGRIDWGVLPNVNVKLQSYELSKMTKMRKANQQTIDSDPQMAIGLLVLKSKMIRDGKPSRLEMKNQ